MLNGDETFKKIKTQSNDWVFLLTRSATWLNQELLIKTIVSHLTYLDEFNITYKFI